jgi:PAS domain S-box-containing protein
MGRLLRSLSLKLALSVMLSELVVALVVGNAFEYYDLWRSDAARLAAAIMAVLSSSLLVLLLLRAVLIARISAAVSVLRRIETGDDGVRLTGQLFDDEVADLARGINTLAAKLEYHRADHERQIAELAEADARAQAGEQQFRALFEKAPIAIWEFDRSACIAAIMALAAAHGDGVRAYLRDRPAEVIRLLDLLRLTAANPATVSLFGAQTWDELRLRPIHALIAPESFDTLIEIFVEGVSDTPISNGEITILRLSGERRVGMIAVRRMEHGAPLADRVIISLIDITASRRAELALRESEERMRTLVENITIGVTLHGPRGEFLLCNPAALALFGVPAEMILDKTVFDNPWSAIDESGAEIPLDDRPVERVIRTGRPVHDMVFGLLPTGQRERVWLLTHAAPQFDADGQLRYVLCSFNDITERRRIDQQLRQSQKMEAVGRLAGGIAHDFNNILTVIIGTSDMLLVDRAITPSLRQDVEQIRTSSLRAADLTRQLLAFSRRQILKPQQIDLNMVVQSIEVMLRRLIGEHIELVTRLAPNLALISADPSQIEQVIMNLSINSRDAMPQGGRLLIETENVSLHADMAEGGLGLAAGDYVRLAVSDTGIGIANEHRAYIFEPFFTTKPVGQGTGLGLSTVHGIVIQSGGAMRFASDIGVGTCFEIYLPHSLRALLPPAAEELLNGNDLGREVVLVVEDELPLRDLARRVLAQHGYTVFTAANGDQAWQLLTEQHLLIDVLLTDMVMPGTRSGSRLAAEVLARFPMTRVIYMSGYSDMALTLQRDGKPAPPFLQKPFTPSTLVRLVRAVLDV